MSKNTLLVFCLMAFNLSVFSTLQAQDTLLKAQYVSLRYDLIKDEQVPLTPADYSFWKSQIGEAKQIFSTEFDISFTAEDSIETYRTLQENTQNFANDFKDTSLLFQNGGERMTMNALMSANYLDKPIGSIITFINDNELYVNKIVGKNQVADSVRARHILIQGKTAKEVDKILSDIKSNKLTWEKANKLYNSESYGLEHGGDLGYLTQGRMVESFDNLCFKIAVIGEYYRVETQFGQHIVQVMDRKSNGNSHSILAYFFHSPIILSKETIKQVGDKAQSLIGESKNIDELEKRLKKAGIAFESTLVYGLESESVANWISNAKDGEITRKPIRTHDFFKRKDKLVIMGARIAKGNAISDEYVLEKFGIEMRRMKKAAQLQNDLKVHKTLESIASKYDVEIRDIYLPYKGEMFGVDEMVSSVSIQHELFKSPAKKLTEPIFGYNGVYVAYVYWKK